MGKLILCRGLPGSGKTTWAKKQKGYVRINRDDIRAMLFPVVTYSKDQEEQVTVIQHASIRAAFKAGHSVIIDDTNLNNKFVRQLMKIAQEFDAEVQFKDFFDVDVNQCLWNIDKRVKEGGRNVESEIVRGMYDRYIKGRTTIPKPAPLPTYEIKPYTEREEGYAIFHNLPWAVIVDIDGTIAKMVDRGPYDWKRVGEDEPVEDILAAVNAMEASGYMILFTSGRDGSCRAETQKWIEKNHHVYGNWKLLMREEKDNRPDWIVKAEIFDKYIRGKYNVRMVFDDRAQVVRMWRKMGLTVAQVAEGEF